MEYNKYFIKLDLLLAKLILVMLTINFFANANCSANVIGQLQRWSWTKTIMMT